MTVAVRLTARRRERRHSRQGQHDRQAGLQSLAGSAGGAGDPSVHRHGLWLQRVLAAARPHGRGGDRRAQADRLSRRRDDVLGKLAITAHALFATDCDWTQFDLGWMFTLFFVVLGSSAAIWGGWLERVGPAQGGPGRGGAAGAAASSSRRFGVYIHQLWLMWLGSGVIGGIGLGLGYISPVSTLVKWFPDRRGMATGMAIMGFGGGAMIGSPLANILMNGALSRPATHRLPARLADAMRASTSARRCYFVLHGRRRVRLPRSAGRAGVRTAGRRRTGANAMIAHGNVHLEGRAQDAAVLADLAGAAA